MKNVLRGALIVLAMLSAASVLIIAAVDLAIYEPHATEIRAIIAQASPEDRTPPELVQDMVHASEPRGIYWQLARILNYKFGSSRQGPNRLISELLWGPLLRMHLSSEEQMSLYCSLIYVGDYGNGLSAASLGLFHKPLSELTRQEAAMVAAYPWGPQYFNRHPNSLRERGNSLLQRSRAGL